MFDYYGHPRCTTSKKAVKELDSMGIVYKFIDLTQTAPSAQELATWMEKQGSIKPFFNTSGIKYRELGLKDKVATFSIEEAAALLASDGMLLKRPLLVKDGQLLQIGYRKPYVDLQLED